MFKKFLSVMFAMVFTLGIFSNTEATEVQIYDGGVDSVLRNINTIASQKGFSIWGTEYYTYQGVKRCEAHFGNNRNNLIRFLLNNDGSVSRVLITSPYVLSETRLAGVVFGSCLLTFGLNKTECDTLISKYMNGFMNAGGDYFHEKYQVWCSATQRYIVLDVETNYSTKMDLYLYAYK